MLTCVESGQPSEHRQDPLASEQGPVEGCQSPTCRFEAAITAELSGISRLSPFRLTSRAPRPPSPPPFSRKSRLYHQLPTVRTNRSATSFGAEACLLLRVLWKRCFGRVFTPPDTHHNTDLLPTISRYFQGEIAVCRSFILLIYSHS